MNKKKYITPSIKAYYLPELCETLINATVQTSNGQAVDSTFPVHNDEETPNGSDTNSWYGNVSNWGGD